AVVHAIARHAPNAIADAVVVADVVVAVGVPDAADSIAIAMVEAAGVIVAHIVVAGVAVADVVVAGVVAPQIVVAGVVVAGVADAVIALEAVAFTVAGGKSGCDGKHRCRRQDA